MMYETAVLKLKGIANGRYCAISFDTSIHADGKTISTMKLYIAGLADKAGYWTESHKDFAGAFTELEKYLADELPGPTDEAPVGDNL